MREILSIFQEVEDPRRGDAKRHDLNELLTIALLSMLAGGRTRVDYCAVPRSEHLASPGGTRTRNLRLVLTAAWYPLPPPGHETIFELICTVKHFGTTREQQRISRG